MLATVIVVVTPITGVFISIMVFAANRDSKFVLVTLTVFLILVVSVALGYV